MPAKKVSGDTKKKVAPKKKVVSKKVETKAKKVVENSAPVVENSVVTKETITEKKVKFNKIYIIFGVAILILIVVFYLLGNGNNFKKSEITPITSVVVEVDNPHELAGKVLIFDIEIKDIVGKDKNINSSGGVGIGDEIKVDYVGKLEDGTVFDSSLEEFAKKMENYSPNSDRKYEPLKFIVGAGKMIKGFDEGVLGMKIGEKKTLTIAPADAYGNKTIVQEVPYSNMQDIIIQEVEKENFQDIISQEIPIGMLGEKGKNLKIGEELEISGIYGKVKNINGDNITLEIENKQNPFYGKKLVVGLEGEYQGNKLTIKKIDDKNITLEIENKQNPFYGKKLVVGLEGVLPNGQKIKITKINYDNKEIK